MGYAVRHDGMGWFELPAGETQAPEGHSYSDTQPDWPPPPPRPVPAVPAAVTRFQARAALLQAGLLDQVNAIMADPATPAIAKLAWADAQEFRRTSPTVLALAPMLGLTEQQLDELFIAAAQIEA